MTALKSLLRRTRRNANLIDRAKARCADPQSQLESFQHLITTERYQQRTVRLLNADFLVADGMSFYYSFEEIFVNEIYKFQSETTSPRIIDCGANYGTSVAYFKQEFPGSEIVAIEADPNVFNLLSTNVETLDLSDVELIHAAVSDQQEMIDFCQEGADSGRVVNEFSTNNIVKVDTVQLDDLIGSSPVDFLKMDIEGAETEVIANSRRLDQVRQVFIEYHSFQNQPQQLNILLDRLTSSGFRYYIHSQFCSPRPLTERKDYLGMDLQLNVFGVRE